LARRARFLVRKDVFRNLWVAALQAALLIYFAKADSAGLVLGARVPIVLTSRADSVRSRTASCAVAVLYADSRRRLAAAAVAAA
jgi:phosphate acetyltransferase